MTVTMEEKTVTLELYIERLRYQALIALLGFFLGPNLQHSRLKSLKHVKCIKNGHDCDMAPVGAISRLCPRMY